MPCLVYWWLWLVISSKWFYDFKTNLACQLFQCHSKLHLTEKNIHHNKQIIKFVAGKNRNIPVCLFVRWGPSLGTGGTLVTTEDCGENWGFWSDRAECWNTLIINVTVSPQEIINKQKLQTHPSHCRVNILFPHFSHNSALLLHCCFFHCWDWRQKPIETLYKVRLELIVQSRPSFVSISSSLISYLWCRPLIFLSSNWQLLAENYHLVVTVNWCKFKISRGCWWDNYPRYI